MVPLRIVWEKSVQKIWNLVRVYLCSTPCNVINIRCLAHLVCEKRIYRFSYSALQNEKCLSVYLNNQCWYRIQNFTHLCILLMFTSMSSFKIFRVLVFELQFNVLQSLLCELFKKTMFKKSEIWHECTFVVGLALQ